MEQALKIIESVGGIVERVHKQTFLQFLLTHLGVQIMIVCFLTFSVIVHLLANRQFFQGYGKDEDNCLAAFISSVFGLIIALIFALLISFGIYKEQPYYYVAHMGGDQIIDCRLQGVEFFTDKDKNLIVSGMREDWKGDIVK